MLEFGEATGEEMEGLSSPAEGYHEYFSDPRANNFTDFPTHKVSGLLNESLNGYFTETEMESNETQPLLLVPFTIYFIAESGRVTGAAQFVHDRYFEVLHE